MDSSPQGMRRQPSLRRIQSDPNLAYKIHARRTRIVCTIGPACNNHETLVAMLKAGMNVARLNFSHGSHETHLENILAIRKACKAANRDCAIMLDTKGPEIRTGGLKGIKGAGTIPMIEKSKTRIRCDVADVKSFEGTAEEFAVDYADLCRVVQPGNRIRIGDGNLNLTVDSVGVGYVDCTVMNTFTLGTNKGVNLPDSKVTLPAMSAQDLKDLEFGCLHKVDLIAASFTRTAQNVKDMREVLRKHGGERIIIIAKIENAEGLENAEAILEAADGLMVARGDMGVEINLERVCMQQKRLIRLCNLHQKPVVTATQMLETMQEHPRPTIAEVSDVTNAVLDGTDCVMLSGETAGGKFPVLTLQTMARICMAAESVMACADHYHNLMDETRLHVAKFGYHFGKIESFAAAAVKSAIDLKASAIIVVTETGRAARLVSKYCPEMPAIAYAQDPVIARQLLLSRAVVPIISEEALDNDEARVEHCLDYALENKLISKGSLVVVMVGQVHHGEGRAEVKAFIV